jgi:inner membrane transporter RhtA
VPSGQAVSLGMTTAALIVVPIGVVDAGSALLSPALVGMGLATALLSSSIPYTLEMVAMKSIPANRFGVLMSVEPAVGALAGALLLGEHLGGLQWLAVALVIAASVGSVVMGDRKA